MKSKLVRSTDDVIRTCVRQSQIVMKTNDSSFSSKSVSESVVFKLARSVYGWGKRPKCVCQSLTLNFYCLFTFNLVSFHASSCLILHAEVSYIIDTACHWSFFSPILPVLATFWIAKTPIFFPFSNSQFLRIGTRRTYIHPFDLDYWAKTRYQPIFRHCLGAVLQYLAIFYETLH